MKKPADQNARRLSARWKSPEDKEANLEGDDL